MIQHSKDQVQRQFGEHAAQYVASQPHAQGYSLRRLVELANPALAWRMLDIATGGGHTALAFAPLVDQVVAGDLTHEMLLAARQHITGQGVRNVAFCQMDAEHLPFPAGVFDCVTCRIAPHHFPDVPRFVSEAVRVLRPGGLLAVADNLSSGEPKAARFYNDLEKLRDPSHHWAYSLDDWDTFFFSAELVVAHKETFQKRIDFDDWAARMGVTGDDVVRLRVLLLRAPEDRRAWLEPEQIGARIVFKITEGIIIGRKAG